MREDLEWGEGMGSDSLLQFTLHSVKPFGDNFVPQPRVHSHPLTEQLLSVVIGHIRSVSQVRQVN